MENTPATGSQQDRVNFAATLLDDLGGATAVEEGNGTLFIRGFACPLSAVVGGHPELCGAVETLLTEVIGTPVRQKCVHGERPQCCFEIARH